MTGELDLFLERLVARCPRLRTYGDQLLDWEIDALVDAIAPRWRASSTG